MRQANGLVLALIGIAVVTMAFRGSLKNTLHALVTADAHPSGSSGSPGGSSSPPARQVGPVTIGGAGPPNAQPLGYVDSTGAYVPGVPGSGVTTG